MEIWDVVDKGAAAPAPAASSGLKLSHAKKANHQPSMSLDAETVNVYRNTHGVIVLFDITKPWTFEYATRQLQLIPPQLSVLLVGNFYDRASKRGVTTVQIKQLVERCNEERSIEGYEARWASNKIRYVEASMLNGYGLGFIYKYFGVPFLQVQTQSLRTQLESKMIEQTRLLQELDGDNADDFNTVSASAAEADAERGDPTPTLPEKMTRPQQRPIASKARASMVSQMKGAATTSTTNVDAHQRPVKASRVLASFQPTHDDDAAFWTEIGRTEDVPSAEIGNETPPGEDAPRDLNGWLDEEPNPMVKTGEEDLAGGEPEYDNGLASPQEIQNTPVDAVSSERRDSPAPSPESTSPTSPKPTADNPWLAEPTSAYDSPSFGPGDFEEDSIAAAWGSIRATSVPGPVVSTDLPRTESESAEISDVSHRMAATNIGYESIGGEGETGSSQAVKKKKKKLKSESGTSEKKKKKKVRDTAQ